MNRTLILTLLLALIALPGMPQAATDDDTEITADTLAPLASWVEQETKVQIHALPITTASGRRLKAVLSMTGVMNARAAAAYLPGQIVISNIMWDPDSIRSRSYLVHELVHHTQLIGRKQFPCAAAKEREAYMLQNRWLEAQGEEPLVTQEWIDRISKCSTNDSDDEPESTDNL